MKTKGELSLTLQTRIRDLIVCGKLQPGERLKEEELSKRFRVSRTPLRQALIAIESEGLILSRPNAGFVVASLSATEVSSLYPIVWTLEALALDETFDLVRSSLKTLRKINEEFLKYKNRPLKARDLDTSFHNVLTSFSGNARLKEIIQTEKKKIIRYEQFYMQDSNQIEDSANGHNLIIEALDKRDRLEVKNAITDNWRHGMMVILQKIQSTD